MGRSSKLTPEREAAILEAVRNGASYAAAAAAAGVSEATVHRWRKRGAAARTGRHRQFVDALALAEAIGEANAAAAVVAAFTLPTVETREKSLPGGGIERTVIERPPDARLALEWLARRFPERWNPRHRIVMEHATIREALAALDMDALDAADLAKIEEILDLIGE